MTDAVARATALNALLDSPDFLAVLTAFRRAANIVQKSAKEAEAVESVPDRLRSDDAELWQAFAGLRGAATEALGAADYDRFYKVMTGLKGPIDTYFDRVLIMDPDPEVRRHRLALLRTIVALLARPADLSRLAI
jgi:glycyl-tRNA synthetase beta chain